MSLKLYWSITNSCNLNCRYCYYNSGLETKIFSQKLNKHYRALLKDIAKNFNQVVFTGGEPLLHPQIFESIEFLKKQGLRVSLLTNGTRLTNEVCKKLINLKIDEIAISLDSLDPKLNNYLRGRSEEVLLGINNILSLPRGSTQVEIMQTVTRKNISSIPRLISFCKKNNLKLWLDPVEINPQLKKIKNLSLLNLNKKQFQQLEKAMKTWAKQYDNPLLNDYCKNCLDLISDRRPEKISCPMGTTSFVLDPDGEIYPCFLRKDLKLGNVYNKKISQILKNPQLKKQQKSLQNADCVSLGCLCMTISTHY